MQSLLVVPQLLQFLWFVKGVIEVDGFPGDLSPYLGLGGWLSVIVLVIISMFRGWLIPGPIHKQIISSYDKQLADKDKQIDIWKDAFKASDTRGDLQAGNISELLDLTKNTNTLIKAYTSSIPSQKEHIQ